VGFEIAQNLRRRGGEVADIDPTGFFERDIVIMSYIRRVCRIQERERDGWVKSVGGVCAAFPRYQIRREGPPEGAEEAFALRCVDLLHGERMNEGRQEIGLEGVGGEGVAEAGEHVCFEEGDAGVDEAADGEVVRRRGGEGERGDIGLIGGGGEEAREGTGQVCASRRGVPVGNPGGEGEEGWRPAWARIRRLFVWWIRRRVVARQTSCMESE